MAFPDNLLSRGERVVLHKHPHWKVLILPTLFFVLIIGGGFALAAVLRYWEYHVIAWIVIGVLGVLGLIFLVVVPVLRWRTEHFVLTNHHVFFRTGILHRQEHQIPLSQIANLETVVTFWGRLLGFGTLIVESAADQPLEFQNVATIPRVQATLNQLIRDERDTRNGPGHGAGHSLPADDEQPWEATRAMPGSSSPPGYSTPADRETYRDQPAARPDHEPGYTDRRRNRPARG